MFESKYVIVTSPNNNGEVGNLRPIGSSVLLQDKISGEEIPCIIGFVEYDEPVEGYYFYHIVSEDHQDNILDDPFVDGDKTFTFMVEKRTGNILCW